MIPKLLAWSSLGTAVVFVIAVLLALFARSSLGDDGQLELEFGAEAEAARAGRLVSPTAG